MTLTVESLKTLKVAELREELDRRGLDSTGLKAALLARLEEALASSAAPAPVGGDGDAAPAAAAPAAAAAPDAAAPAPLPVQTEAVPAPITAEKVRSMELAKAERTLASFSSSFFNVLMFSTSFF
jgi:hypothetical protein